MNLICGYSNALARVPEDARACLHGPADREIRYGDDRIRGDGRLRIRPL
jgi:hypothetical protein